MMENASENIGKLALSLAKAQGAMKSAIKDSTNPHLKSKYANIASVWEACREAMATNEIAVVQRPVPNNGTEVRVETILMHSSGEWISGTIGIPTAQATPQGFGSAITYARRYALMAMIGIAPDDDDDGEGAMGRKQTASKLSLLEIAVGDFSRINNMNHLENHWKKHYDEYKKDKDFGRISSAKDRRKLELQNTSSSEKIGSEASSIACPNADGRDVPESSCSSCGNRVGCPSHPDIST